MARAFQRDRREAARALLVTRNRGWGVVGGVVLAVALPFMRMSEAHADDVIGLAVIFGMFAFIPVAAWLTYHAPRRRAVTLHLDDDTLTFRRGNNELRLARSRTQIHRGVASAMPDGRYRVDLHARLRPRVRLEVDTHDEARALLAALGVDRRDGTTRFRLRWHPPAHGFAIVAPIVVATSALLLVGLGAAWLIGGLILAGLMPLVDRWLFRVDLTIGVDGIETTRGSGERRFIPHARILRVERLAQGSQVGAAPHAGAEVVSPGFFIVLDDGETLSFDTRDERFATGVWRSDPVFEATLAAWLGQRAPSAAQGATAALLRGTRTTSEWVSALRAIGADETNTGYRVAAIDERALFEVVADARASSELRIAAAVALGGHAEHATRLRVVADELAEPLVRHIALRAAEEVSLEEMARELELVATTSH